MQFPTERQTEILRELTENADKIAKVHVGTPHPRQQEFLDLECEEALFGGAAGGGKTASLLMWLAEGVNIPKYSGLFLRRTYAQLTKSTDSPVWRAFDLYDSLGGNFNKTEYRWTFPSGAMIEFGHMQHLASVTNYQGAAYHRVAYDELTQFAEEQYTYLFSRMRKHVNFPISLGIRAGSNPGGIGHDWVKRRFVTEEAEKAIIRFDAYEKSPEKFMFWKDDRAFVPARVADNPTLDIEDYIERMSENLSPVLRERMVNGDWSILEGSVLNPEWMREYNMRGDMLVPLDKKGDVFSGGAVNYNECTRFATIDTAGTEEDKAREKRGKTPSWSVCEVWDYWPKYRMLFLRDVWRKRVGWDGLKAGVAKCLDKCKVPLVKIEDAHWGKPLAAEIATRHNPTLVGTKGKSKMARSVNFQNMLEDGRILLPKGNNSWRSEVESEWLRWTGSDDDVTDTIDTASYAANHVAKPSKASWGGTVSTVGKRPSYTSGVSGRF